jgi:hypothetical protein
MQVSLSSFSYRLALFCIWAMMFSWYVSSAVNVQFPPFTKFSVVVMTVYSFAVRLTKMAELNL